MSHIVRNVTDIPYKVMIYDVRDLGYISFSL